MRMRLSKLWNLKRPNAPVERMPHYGAKERERWKRCYESRYLNERSINRLIAAGYVLSDDMFHDRAAPTICQQSKRQYARSNGSAE